MVHIDQDLCIGCKACAADCPGNAIKMEDNKAQVVKKCIQCGHCVAICPVKAVSIPEYEMEDVEEYEADTFHVCPENFLHAVKFRRSIRNFREQKIEADKAERVLAAGRYTATAKNLQECTFIFVQEKLSELKELVWKEMPGIIESLKESHPDYASAFQYFYRKWSRDPKDDTFFFNTPAFLVVASHRALDGGLAAANIENMAVAEGLGVLYSGYMMRVIEASPVLKEWLGMGDKHAHCCILMGYPAVSYRRTAPRKEADIIWK